MLGLDADFGVIVISRAKVFDFVVFIFIGTFSVCRLLVVINTPSAIVVVVSVVITFLIFCAATAGCWCLMMLVVVVVCVEQCIHLDEQIFQRLVGWNE